ncbi:MULTISPECIES: hypothetical protein [unclassified Janthinobacterium]|uniref:hypothetical protein n=1 Tax=unclassified Janthinobacterium TaxID=2610881 RepID=UPI001E5B9B4D|nr:MULTISPECIES: hypothetical protein [unclassified Janthinobacterium]MCC7641916.1 hypothetical protein [Janthinobacterium sp. EB271-G4-3-1]MCC7690042.1 hypothetical protein [Janthinobacterium sp. EB271-G4-3-2]
MLQRLGGHAIKMWQDNMQCQIKTRHLILINPELINIFLYLLIQKMVSGYSEYNHAGACESRVAILCLFFCAILSNCRKGSNGAASGRGAGMRRRQFRGGRQTGQGM